MMIMTSNNNSFSNQIQKLADDAGYCTTITCINMYVNVQSPLVIYNNIVIINNITKKKFFFHLHV